ncbi:MAG: histidinol-phosphatase HisJ family protein [Spirochaetota bacterium]
MQKLVDYHIHTAVSIDAYSSVEGCCRRAIELGLQAIAFTNHVMLRDPDYLMTENALLDHWACIQVCQRQYPELTIRLGIEIDYYEDLEKEIQELIFRYEDLIARRFDYVLGSVHTVDEIKINSERWAYLLFENNKAGYVFHKYFTSMSQAVRSGLFDVMAHLDRIKKNMGRLFRPVPFEKYRDSAEALVNALLESGVGMEINTKGLQHPVGEMYPSEQLLSLYLAEAERRRVNPIITMGSDAHKEEEVGVNLSQGAALLKKLGQRAITVFDRRQKQKLNF